MENHLKVIALVLPNDPNIKVRLVKDCWGYEVQNINILVGAIVAPNGYVIQGETIKSD